MQLSCAQAAATELVVPTPELAIPKYCEAIHQTRRRPTRTVTVRELRACVRCTASLPLPSRCDTAGRHLRSCCGWWKCGAV
jgi:hypothetical protein